MKTLKFEHELAQDILNGRKTTTVRLFDDKDLAVNDVFRVIDKSDPEHESSWQVIGKGIVNKIIEKRLKDLNSEDLTGYRSFSSVEEIVGYYRNYYGERVNEDTPAKVVYFSFEAGDLEGPTSLPLDRARLYTDGGSRGNPGPSACAYVICNMENYVVEKSGEYLGITTNNQAEYLALLNGVKRLQELNIKEVDAFMDSELIVNQILGKYKIKNAELKPHYDKIKDLLGKFDKYSINHVPRAMNADADREVNRILDENAKP